MAILRTTLLLLLPILAACGGGASNGGGTASERYAQAMAEFEEGKYKTAEEKLNALLLQDPTGEYADDAQFYLAESYFLDGEYRLAAFNFNRVYSLYPTSQYVPRALYRSAQSYSGSAPGFERDQRDTKSAVGLYESFLRRYPSDPLADSARMQIVTLRNRLASKEYAIAELYRKMDDPDAAILYYDRVIADYKDTEYYPLAVAQKATLLIQLSRRTEATEIVKRAFTDHPEWRDSPPFTVLSVQLELR